jgi:tyrocidine synthetase-3
MNTLSFIQKLRQLNIHLQLEGDQLKVDAPKGMLTQELLTEIRSHKDSILQYLRDARQQRFEAISPVPAQSHYALSHAQKRIWVMNELDSDQISYNVPYSYWLQGKLDLTAFDKALQALIQRHESLRTSFVMVGDDPRQQISDLSERKIYTKYTDLQQEALRDQIASEMVKQEVSTPFDLTKAPLIRTQLIRMAEERYIFLLTLHHIVSDGWSHEVLIRDFSLLYEAFCEDKPNPLPPLRIQYKDYAHWQGELLNDTSTGVHRAYWMEQFNNTAPPLDLPTDYPRPQTKGYRGAEVEYTLSIEESQHLAKFAKTKEVSFYMLLQAALDVLLYKYTGQTDIVTACPIAGREHADLEDQIGFYVNTLAIRIRLEKEDTFQTVLERAKEAMLGAYAHQVYPFDLLIEELDLERDLSRSPLTDVMLSLQNTELETEETNRLGGLTIEAYEQEYQVSKFDWTIGAAWEGESLCLNVNYDSDLYSRERMQRMLAHYCELLKVLTQSPDRPIFQISCIKEEEKHLLTHTFNDTTHSFESDETLVSLFRRQVRQSPEAIAVVDGERAITYAELDVWSDEIAHCLNQKYEVLNGDLVGMWVDRSAWMIAGIYGILKAGAAFLPLGIDYPPARIASLIQDAQPRAILVDKVDDWGSRALPSCPLLDREMSLAASEEEKQQASPAEIAPSDLAYVLYTSGSTGMPKGVMIEHRSVINRIEWMRDQYKVGSEDFILQKTPYTFDVSIWEFFLPLCYGAKLVTCEKEAIYDPKSLLHIIETNQISMLHFVPSMYQPFLESMEGKDMHRGTSITRVICSGEALTSEIVRLHHEKLQAELHNLYGPTEATVDVSFYETCPGEMRVPIGQPIWNTSLQIVDANFQLQPIGIPGEILIGGIGLARGYLNRPELTQEKFIDSPFEPGQKTYLTGDVGYWREDGTIQYLGRKDNQIKLRGQRIELGEIEHAIQQVLGQGQAVVLVPKDAQGDPFLLACIVSSEPPSADQIKLALQDSLPAHMIPDLFVFRDELPRTSSGKIDRKLLSKISYQKETSGVKVSPRNEKEQILVSIWEEVLDLPEVGITDNFFAIGGHSLKAIKVISRIQQAFHHSIKLKELFRFPTIEQLASCIHPQKINPAVMIHPLPDLADYELSHAQRRLWILHQLNPKQTTFNMPFVCELSGQVDMEGIRQVFDSLIERHESLRTVFIQVKGKPRQQILTPEQLQFSLQVEQLDADSPKERQIEAVIEKNTQTPFDLETGPLLRVGLLKLEQDRYLFLLTMHHIICDAWSIELMIDEFRKLYHAYIGNEPHSFSPLPIQYKEFAHWQNQQLNSKETRASEAYWMQQFEAPIPPLDLPFAAPRPSVQSSRGSHIELAIAEEQQKQIERLAQQEQVSAFMIFLAAIKVLLYRYTGERDVVVGTTVASRDQQQLEKLVGFFVNTLALRTEIEAADSFHSLLMKVKETALSALEHQAYPFDLLVDQLELPRDVSRSPLFDVLVEMVSTDSTVKKSKEIQQFQIGPYDLAHHTTQYDLSFRFLENEDQISLMLEYCTDLFQAADIQQILNHFTAVLQDVIQDVHRPISQLVSLSSAERNQQLHDFNQTNTEVDLQTCLQEWIEMQADQHPKTHALLSPHLNFSYQELNETANRLAHHLRDHYQVGREDKIGLLMNPSSTAIVSILGILKAGAAFVPIDPGIPTARKEYIVQDAGISILLIDQDQWQQIEFFGGSVMIPELESFTWPELKENPPCINEPTDLAYLIYTSGSTGQPKGVRIMHKSLVNYVSWANRYYFNQQQDAPFALFSSLSFDLTLTSIFTPLFRGDAIVVCDKLPIQDQLLRIFEPGSQTRAVKLTPSHVRVLEFLSLEETEVSTVIVGGEILTQKHCEILFSLNPEINIYNEYGPTEATIGCTVEQVAPGQEWITIGKPISNMQIYLTDEKHNLLPIGMPGEICIAGEGVALGYLNKPELSREKFISNPFGEGQLYLTGDVGRWGKDGSLEFLGRKDDQIKIRGYRIEAGEIEHQLRALDSVQDAMVISHRDAKGDDSLLAYLLTEEEVDPSQIKQSLRQNLPEYMIPGHYIPLTHFPLTVNGKLDRKALPKPQDHHSHSQGSCKAPENQIEQQLVNIWEKVLQREQISTTDNFFDIGGNSLKLVEMYAELEKVFEGNVHIPDLFKFTTIESLQSHLTTIDRVEEADYIEV